MSFLYFFFHSNSLQLKWYNNILKKNSSLFPTLSQELQGWNDTSSENLHSRNTHRFCFLRSMIDIIIEADEFSETDFLWRQYYFQYS